MDQNLSALMHNLSISENRLETLIFEIKTVVASSHSSHFKNIIKAADLESLFLCLDTSEREEIEAICFILTSLLPIVDPVDVAVQLSSSIQKGLTHPNSDVQLLTLKELQRIVGTTDGASALADSPETSRFAIFLVGHQDESLSLAAVKFLSDLGKTSPNAARIILKPGFQPHYRDLKTVMQKSDIVRFRVYEIVCNIQSESNEMLELCIESGLIKQLIEELDGNDVLSKVTCCAMLSEMSSSKHSLDYITQSGVVSKMVEMVKDSDSDPFSDLYVPGLIRFFGNISLNNGPLCLMELYPTFLYVLFSFIECNELPKKQVAIETLGVIGETLEGKQLLSDQGENFTCALKEVFQVLRYGKQDLRLIAVQCVTSLLDHKKIHEDSLELAYAITFPWFQLISNNPIDSIISLCKQPFPDIRCSGYALLNTVAESRWGVEVMVEVATLVEFLLDRATESERMCKDAKFAVVKTLSKADNVASVFGNQNYLRFRQFVNEGPYYVGTQLSVAIDEA
uniref:26S proteasome non-ATPase regulatory subunit 5 n=1 Tax=Ciona savignyi TaxID=51511 RepID=H2YAS0_CIOSA